MTRTNQAVRDAVGEAAAEGLGIRLDDVDGSRSSPRAPAPRRYYPAIDCKKNSHLLCILSNTKQKAY